jgi:ABC-type polar amino acid transport system ATPase subunit
VSSIPAIRVVDLHKSFGPLAVLKGVSFDVPRGAVVSMIGASGSGKSTLLRCINRLETPSAGEIYIDGEPMHELRSIAEINRMRRDLGMVFQQFNLWPHMTVLGNIIEAPIRARGMSRQDAKALGQACLRQVHLAEKADEYPARLSGGQQQRVAIARALAMQPKVMLFDEPTSSLDPELTDEVLSVMRELARAGTTMIVVTHEMAFARDVADQVVVMDAGQVVEQGPAEEVLLRPKNPRTASFLSRFHSTIGERKAP